MNDNTDHMGLVPLNAELTMYFEDFTISLAIAKERERDRIIQLLEPYRYSEISIGKVIELIEGE